MEYILVNREYRVVVRNKGSQLTAFHSRENLQSFQALVEQEIPLGEAAANTSVVQLKLDTLGEDSPFELVSLRSLVVPLSEAEFQLAGRAVQLCRWQSEHRYCGKCGKPTQAFDKDDSLYCPRCQLNFYPRIAPCVIGLVTRGDHCLLARGARHPEAMFSTLAGFIEAGENAEQAFAREVKEEVNVDIRGIRYLYSQPWPFPGQLMLGYTAQWQAGEIEVDGEEILEANWFRYDQLPTIPPESTISGRIIRDFVGQQSEKHST